MTARDDRTQRLAEIERRRGDPRMVHAVVAFDVPYLLDEIARLAAAVDAKDAEIERLRAFTASFAPDMQAVMAERDSLRAAVDSANTALAEAVAELGFAEAELVPTCQHATDDNQHERMALLSVRQALATLRAIPLVVAPPTKVEWNKADGTLRAAGFYNESEQK